MLNDVFQINMTQLKLESSNIQTSFPTSSESNDYTCEIGKLMKVNVADGTKAPHLEIYYELGKVCQTTQKMCNLAT